MALRAALAGKVADWPAPLTALALARQIATLRAQNAALKQALQDPHLSGPQLAAAAKNRELSEDSAYLPQTRKAVATPDPTAYIEHCLTRRQHQVLDLVLVGVPSKNIAADLGISQRTVENHRAAIMRRTGATSLPALARLVIGAAQSGDCKAASNGQSCPAKAIPCRNPRPHRNIRHAPD